MPVEPPRDEGDASDEGAPGTAWTASPSTWTEASLRRAPGTPEICIYQTSTGKLLTTMDGHRGAVHHVRFSPQGNRLYSGSADKTAKVWSLPPAAELGGSRVAISERLNQHFGAVRSLSFGPTNNILASGSEDTLVKVRSPPISASRVHSSCVYSLPVSGFESSSCGCLAADMGCGEGADALLLRRAPRPCVLRGSQPRWQQGRLGLARQLC